MTTPFFRRSRVDYSGCCCFLHSGHLTVSPYVSALTGNARSQQSTAVVLVRWVPDEDLVRLPQLVQDTDRAGRSDYRSDVRVSGQIHFLARRRRGTLESPLMLGADQRSSSRTRKSSSARRRA